MSRIDFRHWKMSTGRHFQNDRHNTAQIQHCPISTPFHMWVDYDVRNWFLTSKIFYRSPFSKWPPQYSKNSTLFDFNVLNLKATFEIEQCWIFAALWWPFWKWRPVEIFRFWESIQDVEIEQCWIFTVLWWPFWKWWPVENFRCQEFKGSF
jgi:hypothetical protein